MEIKKATPQDHAKMTYIWSECIMVTCYFLTTSEINKLEKVFEEKFLNNPEISHFTQWVDGELIGFACMRGNDILFTPIEPKLFGKGYGEFMIKYLLESFDVGHAYTYCSDMHSLAFYSALGFEIEEKIEDIFFGNDYQINQLKLGVSREEAIKRINAKNRRF
ncbi:MAG: putative acetyltransferase [Francisella sp.]|jgi:putative acetyltransferase